MSRRPWGVSRRPWGVDRVHVVKVGSKWRRAGETEVWEVTDLWQYEQGTGRMVLAVTITNWERGDRCMSEARLENTMREVG